MTRHGLVPLLLVAFAAACWSKLPPDKPEPPLTASVPRDAGILQASDDAGVRQNAAMDARLAEYERFHDWRSTVGVVGQGVEAKVSAGAALPKRAQPRKPAQIRLYAFSGQSCVKPSAFGMPFEADGSLCSDVLGKSALLDDGERDAVSSLVMEAEAGLARGDTRPRVRCDFNPHHVFVFFDEKGAPIGRLMPCFECGQFAWEPSMHPEHIGTYEPPQMMPEERRLLAQIADRHGAGAWAFDPDGAETMQVRAYRDAVYGTASEPTPLGRARIDARISLPPPVDRDVSPKRATARDRKNLCTWWNEQWSLHGQNFGSHGYECKSGVTYSFNLEAGDCERDLARCDVPTRQIEECLRAFASPVCDGMPNACAQAQDCVPGLRFFTRSK